MPLIDEDEEEICKEKRHVVSCGFKPNVMPKSHELPLTALFLWIL